MARCTKALLLVCASLAIAETLKEQGTRFFHEKEYHRAVEALTQHLAETPSDYPALLLLGLAQQQTGDAAMAAATFQRGVSQRPKDATAWFYLARAELLAGRLLLATRDAQEALRLGYALGPSWRLLSQIYLESGDYEQAIQSLDRALKASPTDNSLIVERRVLLERLGRTDPAATAPSRIAFRDVSASSGIDFVLENCPTPRKHLIETMPGGIAAFDYDNDGNTDLYFTNGAAIPSLTKSERKYANRLYRNMGQLRFADVTDRAKVGGRGYSMGAAAGDFDNDGHVDLFVAGVRANTLFRNRGDGSFEDVTSESGIGSDQWAVGAGWFDYDRDGRLDLFVVNYVDWSPNFDLLCNAGPSAPRVYCHPKHFAGTTNKLYRNLGGGKFRDVSEPSGIAKHTGKGMAVAFADYDGDGFPDIFVTNDSEPNFLFRHRGNGTFEEVAATAGVAYGTDGKALSFMGVDFRDYNNDGLPDAVVTALSGETFPLFRNLGKGSFADATHESRLGLASARRSGWGVGLVDFDNDGWKDIFAANSHVTDNIETFSPHRYRQHNSCYRNLTNGRFSDVSQAAGLEAASASAHRGAVFADLDNDGRVDVVTSSLESRPEVWRNLSAQTQTNWLDVRLQGTSGNRDGIGAVVRIAGQTNSMTSAVGYASSSHTPVHFGLGGDTTVDVTILWPTGKTHTHSRVAANQTIRVVE